MEMNEVYNPLAEKNSRQAIGKRVASGVASGFAEAAIDFAKDVMPDALKRNHQDREKPVPSIIVFAEDNRKMAAVRAELKTLKSVPVNQAGEAIAQAPHVSFSNLA
jgi:hypothetical protein